METKPFNAKMGLSMEADRTYRVYSRGHEFYLIRIGGQEMGQTVGMAVAHQFGLIGALIYGLLKKKDEPKKDDMIQTLDAQDPAMHLDKHKHNFKFSPAEVKESSLEPPAFFAGHGPEVGRWLVELRDGKKMTFHFEATEYMRTAAAALPQVLGPLLTVNVEWSEENGKFVKRR